MGAAHRGLLWEETSISFGSEPGFCTNRYTVRTLTITVKVSHILQNSSSAEGGLSNAVLPLCQELGRRDEARVELITGLVGSQTLASSVDDAVSVHVARYRNRVAATVASAHIRILDESLSVDKPDVLHLHSLWLPVLSRALRRAKHSGVKVVLSPHGTLEPWSLNWHRTRKRIALAAYQLRDLSSVDGFFATSEGEAASIRRLGLSQPIFVIPNGVDVAHSSTGGATPETPESRPGPQKLLSLGRIHPIKGLENLLTAWAQTRPQGWVLQIAGIDNGGHQGELERLAQRLQLGDSVVFSGPAFDHDRLDIYRGASAFVLPSFSENFGIVVAEALANGLPVIATHGTPWRSLEERGCGWWVAPTTEGIALAIQDLVELPEDRYHDMRVRAEELARMFSWSDIATRTSEAYSSLLRAEP